jgi:hypothetical protein
VLTDKTNATSRPPVRPFNLALGVTTQQTNTQGEHGTENVDNQLTDGSHQSRTWFEACQRNGRMDNEAMLAREIGSYVRYELFPKLKFIMSKRQLEYSGERNTICGLICSDLGLVDQQAAVPWWERYKDMIADVLNAKRADVTGSLKRAFLRKFTRIVVVQ